MKSESGVLIGVCHPEPGVISFVTPVFRDGSGAPVVQRVSEGRIVSFEAVDLGEEFVALSSSVSASIGDPAIYAMQFEDCIAVGSLMKAMTPNASGQVDWSDVHALRLAFERNRHEQSSGFILFPRIRSHPREYSQLGCQQTPDPVLGRSRRLSEEAAYWFLLCMDDPSALRSDRREFLAWMRRSPENVAETFKTSRFRGKLRRLRLWMHSAAGR
jgi:hypothetical protein